MNGKMHKKTQNDTLLWSHIALAYCYVETRFKRQTVHEAIDFVVDQTEFENVAGFGRYRSAKCVWSETKVSFRVSLARH